MRKILPQLLTNIHFCTRCADAVPCGPRPVLRGHGQHRSGEKLLSDVASAAQRVQKLARRRARALVKAKNGATPTVSDFPSLGSIGKRRHAQVAFQRSAERLPWDFKASSGRVIASLNCFAPIAMSG